MLAHSGELQLHFSPPAQKAQKTFLLLISLSTLTENACGLQLEQSLGELLSRSQA